MICTNCKHEKVCKYINNMEEVNKMVDSVNSAEDPIRLEPGCSAYDAMDTIVREAERSW